MPYLSLDGVSRNIHQLNTGHRLKEGVSGEDPDHFLIARYLERLRRFSKFAVAEPIRKNEVSVWQILHSRHELQFNAR